MEEDEFSSSYSYSEESFSGHSDDPVPVNLYTKDYKLHEFSFSTTDRTIPDVPLPRDYKLSDDQFWTNGKLNVENIKEHLAFEGTTLKTFCVLTLDSGRLKKEHVMLLIDQVYALFCAEPNVLLVPAPVTVVSWKKCTGKQ
jgi:hypothetical protein